MQRSVWYINESLLTSNSAKINSALPGLKKKVEWKKDVYFSLLDLEYYLLAIRFAELAKTEAQCLCFWGFDYFGCQDDCFMVLFLIRLPFQLFYV